MDFADIQFPRNVSAWPGSQRRGVGYVDRVAESNEYQSHYICPQVTWSLSEGNAELLSHLRS